MKRFLAIALFLFVSAAHAATLTVYKSEAEAREWVEKTWYPAWVGGEPIVETLVALFAKDGVYIDPSIPGGAKGHDELRAFFKKELGANPNMKFRTAGLYPTEKGFVLNWVGKIPVGDRVVTLPGADIIEFNKDGKLTRVEEFFDRVPLIENE